MADKKHKEGWMDYKHSTEQSSEFTKTNTFATIVLFRLQKKRTRKKTNSAVPIKTAN
jgi:hypothetical protein